MLGETADLKFGHAQHLGHFRHGAAGLKGRETANHRRMFQPVPRKNQVHHVVLPVVGEVDVDVRQLVQLHPLGVQKAPEIEIEPDRADAADAKTVADQRVSGAPPGDPLDAPPPAFLEQVPHAEEVFLVADRGDDGQFLLHLQADLLDTPGVAAVQPLLHQVPEEGAGRRTVRGSEHGELGSAQRQLKGAPPGQFQGMSQSGRMAAKERRHLGRRAKMVFAVQPFAGVLLPQQRARSNGLHDVPFPPVARDRIVGRQEGQGSKSPGTRSLGCLGVCDRRIETVAKNGGQPRIDAHGHQAIR